MPIPAAAPTLISRFGAAATAAGLTMPPLALRPEAAPTIVVGCNQLEYAAIDASFAAPIAGRAS